MSPPRDSERRAGSSRHIPALDGVRGAAALAVALYHFGVPTPFTRGSLAAEAVASVLSCGWVGVDLFFVLSGFLIGGILLDTRNRSDYLRTFYTRRALRIFPLYFVFVALIVLVIVGAMGSPSDIGHRQAWLWAYLANIDIAWHGWYEKIGNVASGLWSLAIEEQFYLVAPFVILFLRPRAIARVAIGCVLFSIVIRIVFWQAGRPDLWGYVLTPARLDALSIGVLIALAARSFPGGLDRPFLDQCVPAARVTLLITAGIATVLAARGQLTPEWPGLLIGVPALAVGFGALLVLVVSPAGSRRLRMLFESRALRFYGLYSYSLYVWHPLVSRVMNIGGLTPERVLAIVPSNVLALVSLILIKLAVSTVVAIVSYRVIEKPFLNIKEALARRGPAAAASPQAAAVPAEGATV